jgi:hypothetical protein
MTNETELAERLVATFPILTPVLLEHLSDQEGELLPYLFFGDVAGWLVEQPSGANASAVEPIVSWLEDEYAGGSFDIRNLIDVGIVEMLPASPTGDPILGQLGPHLRQRAEVAGLL